MPAIAFATCAGRPAIEPDDALAVACLPPPVEVVAAPWSEARDWSRFDAVVVRSTWDYHLRPHEFELWLEALAANGVPVWNPVELLRWNLRKTYLRDLAERGVEVVPTRFVAPGEELELEALLAAEGWARAVIKPVVGASSSGLRVVERRRTRAAHGDLETAAAAAGALVQPLLPEVAVHGEWSLVFFDGRPSHAVLKRARPGEIRVQSDFGGSVRSAEPPPELRRWARSCLEALSGDWLYARVDAVETAAGPLLMELELIEPQLFLGAAPGAARRFAAALLARLG